MATTLEEIQKLAKRLKDHEAREILDYMRWMIEEVDREPLSEQERADIEESKAERARGGGESLEKVKRDLGL